MKKSESKYYNTALLMNQALVEILNKKDYEFITIKEICKKAGVNRSTFYLHYDNIDDLLYETIETTNKKFFSCFAENDIDIAKKIQNHNKEDLILITPEYLLPYLNYIKENKVVFQVSAKHPIIMQSIKKYNFLQENILYPIFRIFDIEENQKKYFSAYYINGIYALIDEWIKGGCKEETSMICDTIISCVRPFEK
ncbi:MAG: TetR/AcrR family transcriptional regulator [Anaeroplasmataceae bacterium]|nr:TetR/AcrR family transcriptional regulator [Anaeroplasmataceae bacterium]